MSSSSLLLMVCLPRPEAFALLVPIDYSKGLVPGSNEPDQFIAVGVEKSLSRAQDRPDFSNTLTASSTSRIACSIKLR